MSTSIKENFDEVRLHKLKSDMGRGYATKVQAELKRSTGKSYTKNYIYRALTEKYAENTIIEAALRVASKRRKELEELQAEQRY